MQNQEPVVDAIPLDDLFSVEAFAAKYSERLTVPCLRWQLRHRGTNGLSEACVFLGKKLLISKTRYQQWLAKQAGTGRASA